MKDIFIRRPVYFYILFIPFLLLGIIAILTTEKGTLFLSMNQANSPFGDMVFPMITWLGQGISFLIVSILVLFFHRGNGILGLLCFGVSSGLAQLFKKIIFTGFYRPVKYFGPDADLHLIDGISQHHYHSFPSGHSATVFSMALFLTLIVKNKKWGLLFCILAVIVSYSRVYIAQHFFEDIIAGSILGVISTLLVFLLFEKWIKKKQVLNKPLF